MVFGDSIQPVSTIVHQLGTMQLTLSYLHAITLQAVKPNYTYVVHYLPGHNDYMNKKPTS